MSEDETTIVEDVLSYEEAERLFDVEVRGVPLWERWRTTLPRLVKQHQNIIDEPHRYPSAPPTSRWRGYFGILRSALANVPTYNPWTFEERDLLVWGHSRRKKQDDGYWWDIYTDPIYEYADFSYVHFEQELGGDHLQPAKTANLFYTDEIPTYARVLRKFGNGPTVDRREVEPVRALERNIRADFGVNLAVSDGFARHLEIEFAIRRIYQSYLQHIDPNIAVVVVSYGKEPFVQTCKDEGIPVVELQHGVIHEGHLGYHFPGERTKVAFPDYLLVWGEFWKDCVEYPIPDERVLSVGYPYLEQSVEKYDDIPATDQILFVSQGTIGEQLSKFALAVDEHPDIDHEVVYKLHPGEYYQWQEEYPWLANADFEVVDDSDRDLYRLFAESTVQVGAGSTAVYEGLCFDLDTYVYDCPESFKLAPLVEEGTAEKISTADELASLLGSGAVTFDREYYFEPDATANVRRTLRELSSDNISPSE